MNIDGYIHGIYPRSEDLVQATRDLERGRTTQDKVDETFRKDRDTFVRVQQDAGLERISDGLLRWQDIFRPFVETASGLRAGPLTRWFDNNQFFRAPEVEGGLSLRELPAVFAEGADLPGAKVATLPSPYLFSRATHTDGDRDALMEEFAREILKPAVGQLAERGYTLVQLNEPWLAFHGADASVWPKLERCLSTIREGLSIPLVFHTYYGDAAPIAERLKNLPVDAVGIDLVETDPRTLGKGWNTGVVAGAVSGRNSLVESADATVKLAQMVAEELDPPTLYISNAGDLELVPEAVAPRKVALIGNAVKELRT